MSRFAHIFLCAAALALCLVALPLVSTGQQATTDSHPGRFGTRPPKPSSTSPSQVKPDSVLPEGTVTIYSNFGPGYSYYCCEGWDEYGLSTGIPYIAAMAFTPTQGNYLLSQIDFMAVWFGGTNGLKLELRGDLEGHPGPVFGSWRVTGLPEYEFSYSSPIQTIRVHQPIGLKKNHQYWLVLIPDPDAELGWNGNYDDIYGNMAWSDDGGLTWETGYDWNGAFDVLGMKLY